MTGYANYGRVKIQKRLKEGFILRHEKIEQIFASAIEIFSDRGFEKAKMDEIAQKANVAKGTIYYHFRSKEELFEALMQDGLDRLFDRVERAIQPFHTPTERLQAWLQAHLDFFIENGKLAKLLLNEVFGTQKRQQQLRQRIREYIEMIARILEEGQKQHQLHFQYPIETATAIFGAASVAVLQKLYSVEEKTFNKDETSHLYQILEQFICQPLIKKEN